MFVIPKIWKLLQCQTCFSFQKCENYYNVKHVCHFKCENYYNVIMHASLYKKFENYYNAIHSGHSKKCENYYNVWKQLLCLLKRLKWFSDYNKQ